MSNTALAAITLTSLGVWSALILIFLRQWLMETRQAWCEPRAMPRVFGPSALALILILASRILMIHLFGSPIPYWDQWGGEAVRLYIPYEEGQLQWQELFRPHNEHRIFFTRVLLLELYRLHDGWNAKFQMYANLVVYFAALVVLYLQLLPAAVKRARWVWGLALVFLAVFTVPFDWENVLAGFQSQFYFALLAALLILYFGVSATPFSSTWYLTVVAVGVSYLTMASAFLAVVPLFALETYRWVAGERRTADYVVQAITYGALIVLGLLLKGDVPAHEELHAASIAAFATAMGRALSFPAMSVPWAALILWLPFLAGVLVFVRYNERNIHVTRVLLLGGWVIVQAAAFAYARGGEGIPAPSRYLGIFSIGPLVNVALLMHFLQSAVLHRPVALGVAALWLAFLGVGLGTCIDFHYANMRERLDISRGWREQIAEYDQSKDARAFSAVPRQLRPHPHPEELKLILDSPILKRDF